MSDRSGLDHQTECWRFRIHREQIVYVRFVLEAYEGLAQMSSEAGQDEVVWLVAPSQREAARHLAHALELEAGLIPLQPWA